MKDFSFRLFAKILASIGIAALTVPVAGRAEWWVALIFALALCALSRAVSRTWLIPLWISALVLLGTNMSAAGFGAILGLSLPLIWIRRVKDLGTGMERLARATLFVFLGILQGLLYGFLPGACLLAASIPIVFSFVPAPYRRVVVILALAMETILFAANLELMFSAICGAVYGPSIARAALGAANTPKRLKKPSIALAGEEKK